MNEEKIIKNTYYPTKDFYKEFNLTWRYKERITNYALIIFLSILSLIILILGDKQFSFIYNIFILFFVIYNFTIDYISVNYKRLLISFNNDIPNIETTFTDDKIIIQAKENKSEYSYDLVKKVIEGKQLIILKLPSRLGIIIDKNNMTDDNIKKLRQLLINKCKIVKINIVPNYIQTLKIIAATFSILIFVISLIAYIN